MNNLTFEILNNDWNAIRMSGAPNIHKIVPGLIDSSRILMQRVSEDTETITIMFTGFDQALDNPDTEAQTLKKVILAWIKKFAEAQIQRGDPDSFIVRVVKPQQIPQPPSGVAENRRFDVPLVNISSVRKIHGR